MRKRIALCLFISVSSIAFLTVDHHFRSAARLNPLFAPVTLSEPASAKTKADFKAAEIAASKIQCNLQGVSFVTTPNTPDIQVLGLNDGKLYIIAGQFVSFKRDVLESKLTSFNPTKPCSVLTLGGDANVSVGKWKNSGTMSAVIFDKFGIADRIVTPGETANTVVGETGRYAY